MAKLCSLVYTPNAIESEDVISYLCSDNRVHIRFRDFQTSEILTGFEKKLTYLITYLMNYAYLPQVIGEYEDKALINNFLKTSDLTSVYNVIKANEQSNKFRGLKLRKNFKKQDCKAFGSLDSSCFPIVYKNGIAVAGSLDTFLNAFKISLKDYLFNDNYTIMIHSKKEKDVNDKFINKAEKKKQRKTNEFDLIKLW